MWFVNPWHQSFSEKKNTTKCYIFIRPSWDGPYYVIGYGGHESKSTSDSVLCRYTFIGSLKAYIPSSKGCNICYEINIKSMKCANVPKKVRKVGKLKQNMMWLNSYCVNHSYITGNLQNLLLKHFPYIFFISFCF
jgi:hypothetical protein